MRLSGFKGQEYSHSHASVAFMLWYTAWLVMKSKRVGDEVKERTRD